MAKKKKVDAAVVSNNTCPHCTVVFAIPARWCPHCEDHHEKGEMDPSTGWCKRCRDGLNEEYLEKRRNRKDYVPADPSTYGRSDMAEAFMRWVTSSEYKHRFFVTKELSAPAVVAKMEDDDHQRWIDAHFPGL